MKSSLTIKFLVIVGFVVCAWAIVVTLRYNIKEMIRSYHTITNSTQANAQSQTNQEIHLTNPLKDAAMDEPKTDTPFPREEEPRVTTVIEGTEEFDGKHALGRELTEREKDLARILLRIAKMAGSKHYALTKPKPDGLMVATVIGVGEEFDGYWVRDKKLAEWEKELVRGLLKLAKEGGGEYEPDEKK